MASTPEQIEFPYHDLTVVAARMEELAQAGAGWINLFPELGDDEAPPDTRRRRGVLSTLFGSGGPPVPVGTWVAATDRTPATLGVEHGLRTRVMSVLREHEVPPPAGWTVVQDNAGRGLVVRPPPDTAPDDVLVWLMEVVDVLCPVQLTGQWLAEVHAP